VRKRYRFGLLDLVVLLAVLCICVAPLLSLWTRGSQGRAQCADNLRQIGTAIGMYAADWNDGLPFAVDPGDRSAGRYDPFFQDRADLIFRAPMLHDVLRPYVASKEVFHCPQDGGFDHFHGSVVGIPAHARPTCFAAWGTSYNYHSQLAFDHIPRSAVAGRGDINQVFDAHGSFHAVGAGRIRHFRYNVLYTDGHVANVSRAQYVSGWRSPSGYRGGYRAAD